MGASVRKLKVIEGDKDDVGREFDLPEDRDFVIGRALDTNTAFHDTQVSGRHGRIYVENDSVYLVDLGSSNGTFLDDSTRALEAKHPVLLTHGQIIRLGKMTRLEFIDESVHLMKTQQATPEQLAELRKMRARQATVVEKPRRGPLEREPGANIGLAPGSGGMRAMGASAAAPAAPPAPPAPTTPPPQTIAVNCTCGQQLLAREQYAGMQVRCPNCRNMVMLPGRAALAQPVAPPSPLGAAPSPSGTPGFPPPFPPPGQTPPFGAPAQPLSVPDFGEGNNRKLKPIVVVAVLLPVILLIIATVVVVKMVLSQ